MRKLLIALSLAILALPAQAATIPSVASGEAGTYEAALANALRHAVEQVVGMSIGTSTYVSNLKSIQDKVYTAASGYIESYEVVDKSPVDGGFRVTVSAQVSKEKLSSAVTPIIGGSVVLDGKLALANLNLDLDNMRSVERTLKGFLDELLGTALVVSFKEMRTESDTSDPESIKLYFDGLTTEFDEDWYQRFRKFHKSILGKPYTSEVLYHARQYAETAFGSLDVDLLDANGEIIVRRVLGYTNSVRQNTCSEMFSTEVMPVIPPTLTQGERSRIPYVEVTPRQLKRVASVRIHQPEWREWPAKIE